jgi:hypothetical protein
VAERGQENCQDPRNLPLILGAIVGCLAYAISHRVKAPGLNYLPESSTWSLAPPQEAIAMTYYGVVLYGLVGLAVGVILGKLLGSRLATPSATRALTASAVAIALAALGYFAVVELS